MLFALCSQLFVNSRRAPRLSSWSADESFTDSRSARRRGRATGERTGTEFPARSKPGALDCRAGPDKTGRFCSGNWAGAWRPHQRNSEARRAFAGVGERCAAGEFFARKISRPTIRTAPRRCARFRQADSIRRTQRESDWEPSVLHCESAALSLRGFSKLYLISIVHVTRRDGATSLGEAGKRRLRRAHVATPT